jgi:hypothetical protein
MSMNPGSEQASAAPDSTRITPKDAKLLHEAWIMRNTPLTKLTSSQKVENEEHRHLPHKDIKSKIFPFSVRQTVFNQSLEKTKRKD